MFVANTQRVLRNTVSRMVNGKAYGGHHDLFAHHLEKNSNMTGLCCLGFVVSGQGIVLGLVRQLCRSW